eukprot:CAMPEP_0119264688 /NCGR_PEP_ID=MMETSP1329-20130426/3702_1 /TAXON_ID=114041 /ORGANISM="Genus nov. species nov., Strain RCC1024" /LENGTH=299 /DNA_ID=CAMNT_0007264475 /DNA_START=156 /DNA_END=1052 /DNA_ORIENTATION=+
MFWSATRAAWRLAPALSTFAAGSAALSHERVPLASSVSQPHIPTTVLVHGLDSSKETWKGVLAGLSKAGKPALALDLRGHGESPLGDPAAFSLDALARDVVHAVEVQHNVPRPWILVGHSMGGRVAMRVADLSVAEAPDRLAAVVIEDMDTKPREKWGPADIALPPPFERRFPSLEAAKAALLAHYNDPERVESWVNTRVRPLADGSWWSDVNPQAQQLARARVLASNNAAKCWHRLAAADTVPFDVHLWVAGPEGTVVDWDGPGGISDMTARLAAATSKEFPDAGHSIHNWGSADAFL